MWFGLKWWVLADKLCPLCWPPDHFAFNNSNDGKCDLGSCQIENNGERLTEVKDAKKGKKAEEVREGEKKDRQTGVEAGKKSK